MTEIVSMRFCSTMMQLISLVNFTAFHNSKSFKFNIPHSLTHLMKRRYHKFFPELLLKDTDGGSTYAIITQHNDKQQ
jgi:hypothetical protein